MKHRNFLIPGGALVAGFSLAWIIAPLARPAASGQGEGLMESGELSKSSVRSHDRRESSGTTALLDRLLASMEAGKSEPGKISEADYLLLLTELLKREGTSDESSNDYNLMRYLIRDWYDANPDAALKWVLELENDNGLLSTLIDKVADKDPEAAIALAEQHGAAQSRHLNMPLYVANHIDGADAETLLRVLRSFQYPVTNYNGRGMDIPENFDFRHALDGLTEIQSNLKDGTKLSYMPENLLSEWAKRDWDTAWEWAASGEKSEFKNLSEIVNQAIPYATTEQIAGYAAQIASLPNRSPEENFRDAELVLSNRPSPELVANFLSQMPGDRQENLNSILAASLANCEGNHYTYAHQEATQENLLSQMTPAERVAAFQSDAVQQWKSNLDWETSDSLLRRLGHSDEEIARMLPPKPKE